MKIYVDEGSQSVRIDFGEKRYVLAELSQFTGKVIANTGPAWWSPSALGKSELVYETPEPGPEWPTKANAMVVAEDPQWESGIYVREYDYWVSLSGDTVPEEYLKLVRVIFEGEDTQ